MVVLDAAAIAATAATAVAGRRVAPECHPDLHDTPFSSPFPILPRPPYDTSALLPHSLSSPFPCSIPPPNPPPIPPRSSGLGEAFLGTIILPIAGNACEHMTAVIVATKNKMDL